MNGYLIANHFILLCSIFGAAYGIVKFHQQKRPLFGKMITMSIATIGFGRLFQVIRLWSYDYIFDEFQLGIFGVIGSLLFFSTADFGLIDFIGDDRSKELRKYRLISGIAPVVFLMMYLIRPHKE